MNIIAIIVAVWILAGVIGVIAGLAQMALGLGWGLLGLLFHGLACIADLFEKKA